MYFKELSVHIYGYSYFILLPYHEYVCCWRERDDISNISHGVCHILPSIGWVSRIRPRILGVKSLFWNWYEQKHLFTRHIALRIEFLAKIWVKWFQSICEISSQMWKFPSNGVLNIWVKSCRTGKMCLKCL